jgi:protease II
VIEYEEWGNPSASAEFYDYMKSYSPMDNVVARDYPNMLLLGGLNDPRVAYWVRTSSNSRWLLAIPSACCCFADSPTP